jgi:hypothetical protein
MKPRIKNPEMIVTEAMQPQLHHDVRRAVVEATDVEHAAHVLRAQPRHRARLAQEPGDERRVLRELVAQDLHRDRLIELEVRPGEHDAHAAEAEQLVDADATDDRARLEHASVRITG